MRYLVFCLALIAIAPLVRAADETPATRPNRLQQGGREPGALLKAMRERMSQLNLTEDQKKKIEEIIASGEKEMKQAVEKTEGTPQERRQKIVPIVTSMREKIAGVLTDEQKEKLRQMGPIAGGGGAAGAGNGNMAAKVRENLEKLDLSADQKTKATAVLDDTEKKTQAMRAEMENGNADREKVNEKGQQIREETRQKLHEILTPEQEQKLQSLMQAEGGPGAGQRAGRRSTGATSKPAQ